MTEVEIPVSPSYLIDEEGRIRRKGKDTYLRPCVMKRGGYLAVNLWEDNRGKLWPVAVLVALSFHGPRPSRRHHAAHDDGDKTNNRKTNVWWKTKEENEADKIRHGTTNRGERNGRAKLTDEQAREIKERSQTLPRSSGGVRIKKGALPALALEYGVTASCLRQIITGLRREQ